MAADHRVGRRKHPPTWADRDLLSILCHDIQDQLSMVLILAQQLREATPDLARVADPLDRIEAAVRDASALALNVQRAGDLDAPPPMRAGHGSVARIVSTVVAQQMPRVRAKRIELTFEVDDALPEAAVDESLLRQAVANVFGRALRNSPQASRLTIAVRPARAGIEMTIDHPASASDVIDVEGGSPLRNDAASVEWFVARKLLEAHGGSLHRAAAADGRAALRAFLPATSVETTPPHSR